MTQADRVHSTPPLSTSVLPTGDPPTRRRFLSQAAGAVAGSTALIGAASVACPAVAAVDPIYAAIAAHERAAEAYTVALLRQDEDISDPQIQEAILDATELAAEADTDAAWEMVNTIPTTVAGAVALLKYSMSGEHRYGCEWPHLFDEEDTEYEHAKPWDWFLQRTLVRSLEAIAS